MHYVVGDVHGCYDEMVKLLEKIESQDEDAKIIFVGDLIDRGPKVKEVLDWAMKNVSDNGKYQCIRGNHEQMAIDYLFEYEDWYKEREEGIPRSSMPISHYDISSVLMEAVGVDCPHPKEFEPYLGFFKSLKHSKKLTIQSSWGREIVFRVVHADYNYNTKDRARQHHYNLWKRNYWGNKSNEIVVHGHTPTFDPEYTWLHEENTKGGMISYRMNDINVDGGCVFGKRYSSAPNLLCAIRLEDLEEFYHISLEERFKEFDRESYLETFNRELEKCSCPARQKMLKKMGKGC